MCERVCGVCVCLKYYPYLIVLFKRVRKELSKLFYGSNTSMSPTPTCFSILLLVSILLLLHKYSLGLKFHIHLYRNKNKLFEPSCDMIRP